METNPSTQNCKVKSVIDLIKLIEDCQYSVEGDSWKDVSPEGKDLVR